MKARDNCHACVNPFHTKKFGRRLNEVGTQNSSLLLRHVRQTALLPILAFLCVYLGFHGHFGQAHQFESIVTGVVAGIVVHSLFVVDRATHTNPGDAASSFYAVVWHRDAGGFALAVFLWRH